MSENPQDGVSRRDFVKSTTVAGATALAAGCATSEVQTANHTKKWTVGANEKVTLAWIGCGGRGKSILKRALTVDDIQVAAVCDLKADRAAQAADICAESDQKVTQYTDFRKLLDKEKLDGVVVATEVGNHAKCAIPVLEAGLHCFSEKPMDCTVEKVDAVVNAARKAKGIYQIGFQRRYNPNYRACIAKIHSGDLGRVRFLQGHWIWDWNVGGWVLDVDMSGGELVEQAGHHMDVMNWVMGNEAPVRCVGMASITKAYENPPEHISEDKSAVSFEFANSAIFQYTHLFRLSKKFVENKNEMLWVAGDNGCIDIGQGMYYPNDGTPERIAPASPDWDAATREEFVGFAQNCKDGNMPASNVETGRVSTLMALMGRKAFYDRETKTYRPKVMTWKDLGSKT